MSDVPVFQVSECIEALNQHLSLVGEIVVEGEISRFDLKNGKLIFGAVKDAAGSLDFFALPYQVKNFRQFEPGMLVHLYGTAGLYKGSGKFRLLVRQLAPVGEGSLQIAFEKLKRQLEAEGLFVPERKRPLPAWPKTIGLITAPGSSAQADLLKIISARMGGLTLKTFPVSVQGREAVPTLLKAFSYINHHPSAIDVVILARGGGSLEDLAAFNSEDLCRAVFACPVPVVSAIGHEDNWSLTDFVADLRASTPSNAAELVVRDRREVLAEISASHRQIHTRLIQTLRQRQLGLEQSAALIRRRIQTLTATVSQTLAKVPVIQVSLQSLLKRYHQSLTQVLPGLHHRLTTHVTLKRERLTNLERLINSLDYRQVLARGYSITTLGGRILHDPAAVHPGDTIKSQLAKGDITSRVL